jgi:benzoylformate decarboxylase
VADSVGENRRRSALRLPRRSWAPGAQSSPSSDGAFQYSVQSLYTAAQQKLKLIYIVPCNDEYAILKNFAVLENTPNVPALDLPGLDIVGTAKAFGCIGVAANMTEDIKAAFKTALSADGPTVIAIRIAKQLRPLVPDVD